jgi:hypothetical protein
MKKYLAAVALRLVFLVVFIPFASNSPDGLEKAVESMGVQESDPLWRGIMF